VRVKGRFRTDDSAAILSAVANGLGIGFGPLWQVRELLDRGIVEVVLQDFETHPMPIHAVLPPTRTQPAKVRAFVDLLGARVRSAEL
jgi:DNA-binding transcriptional LysR family regulator